MNEMQHNLLAIDEPAPATVHNENGASPFLSISSNLIDRWSKSCLSALIDSVLENSDAADSIDDDFAGQPVNGRASVQISGNGAAAGGAVFDIGPFSLGPP
jgi:hypothetical protein